MLLCFSLIGVPAKWAVCLGSVTFFSIS